jgi:peroxiredoxin
MTEELAREGPATGSHNDARRSRAERFSGYALGLLMLAAFLLVLRQLIEIASGPAPLGAGSPAPAFSAATPSGAPIALADFQGKVILVDFWATWCPPCVASMPALERLHKGLGPRGLVVFGVNQEAGEEDMVQDFIRRRNLTFPMAIDDGSIARTWGVFTYPTSFLLDREGVVRSTYRGAASESRLRRDIEAVLGEASR